MNVPHHMSTSSPDCHTPQEEFVVSGIYIAFADEYDFDEPFPEGVRYSKSRHTIHFTPNAEDCDDLMKFQEETLDKLLYWAEMLFAVDEYDNMYDDDGDEKK